jgi:hypothetical protein
LEVVQLVVVEDPVLVDVGELENAGESGDAGGFEGVLAGVVERGSGVQDGVLGKVEDFRDVDGGFGGAFDAGLILGS